MVLCVGDDSRNLRSRDLKLFSDLIDADAVVEVSDNRANGHAGAAQHRRTALHAGLCFNERALGPVDVFY